MTDSKPDDTHSSSWAQQVINPDYAKRYLELVNEQLGDIKTQSIELLHLRPGHRALDVGCGIGHDAERMARMVGAEGHVSGLDANAELIAQAKQRVNEGTPWLEFRVGDAYALPFQDNSFDACRTDRVLQHLDDPVRVVMEMVRVTRAGGRISIMEPDWYSMTIAGGDVAIAQKVVAHRARNMMRQGDMGRRIPGLLAAADCTEMSIKPCQFSTIDLSTAEFLLYLKVTLDAVVKTGDVTLDAASEWWQALTSLDKRGGFLAIMGGVITAATVS